MPGDLIMNELLGLFTIGLFITLFWGSYRVSFNKDYLELSTAKYFKGWFSLVIVLNHLAQWIGDGWFFQPLETVGYLGVAVFFFFSGFGCQKRYMTVPNYETFFLKKRLSTLFVPYFVATACYVIIQSCYGITPNLLHIFIPSKIEGTFLPYAWYIFSIAAFYIVFCGFMKWCKRNYKMIMLGMIVYCIAYIIFCRTQHYHPTRTLSIVALPLGVFLAWKEDLLTCLLQKFYKYTFFVLTIGVYMMVLYYQFGKEFSSLFFCNFNSILCILALLLFSAKIQIGNKVLRFLGNIYLEIYLVHGIVICMGPMRRPHAIISNDFLWCLAVVIGSIGGGYVLHNVCQNSLREYQRHFQDNPIRINKKIS